MLAMETEATICGAGLSMDGDNTLREGGFSSSNGQLEAIEVPDAINWGELQSWAAGGSPHRYQN